MSIEADGLEEVRDLFKRLQERTNNLRSYFQGMGQIIQNSIENSFENEKSANGTPWTPLKSKTIATKRRLGLSTPNKKLYGTGRLQGSIYTNATNSSVTVGVNATSRSFPYGAVHQYGSTSRKIPARPFLPINSNNRLDDGVKQEIMEYLEGEILE